MNVLLLGGGGREHAIGWKLAQSPRLDQLVSAPGNPGLRSLGEVSPTDPTDPAAVVALARTRQIDLVVVGPEAPLAAGVADALIAAEVPVLGPTKAAARLETSKAFAKDVMERAGVATADWAVFGELAAALKHLETAAGPFVIKADGLAAGKGVLVTDQRSEAAAWVRSCFDGRFGSAGSRVIIEDFLDGPEISVFALCSGADAIGLGAARDYKRLEDGDRGPNTGGMGAFAPVEGPGVGFVDDIVESVIRPVLGTMAAGDAPYSGFLYAGLVLTSDGPKLLEFNCRLGDPETQVVLPLLDNDLVELLAACATEQQLPEVAWSGGAAVNVVLATKGYPEAPAKGDEIRGLDAMDDMSVVFHGGTTTVDGRTVTGGGRVLSVVGLGPDVPTARERAYARVDTLDFAGKHYRKDIAR